MLYLFCEKKITRRDYHITFQSFLVAFIWRRNRVTFSHYFLAPLKYMKSQVGVDFPFLHFPFQWRSPSRKSEWLQGLFFASCTSSLPSLTYPSHTAVALQDLHHFPGWVSLEITHTDYLQAAFLPRRVHGPWTSLIFWCFCPWQSWLPALSKQECSGLLERHLALLPFASMPSSPSSVHPG